MGVDWKMVEREVAGTLRSRRLGEDRAREITQTALERIVREKTPDWSTDDAVRWGVRVALNLAVDDRRRMTAEAIAEMPDRLASVDVEELVLARLEIERVGRALGGMSDRDREILLDLDPRHIADPSARTRAKVARFRARSRLRQLLDSAGGWLVARPGVRRLLDFSEEPAARIAACAVVAAVGGAQTTSLPPLYAVLPLGQVVSAVAHFDAAEPLSGDVATSTPAFGSTTQPSARADQPPARPGWAERGGGETIAELGPDGNGDGRGDGLYWWEDDPEHDDDPVTCVWVRAVGAEQCSATTWGDARDLSPVGLPETPT